MNYEIRKVMNGIVIYSSNYGMKQQYAEEFYI